MFFPVPAGGFEPSANRHPEVDERLIEQEERIGVHRIVRVGSFARQDVVGFVAVHVQSSSAEEDVVVDKNLGGSIGFHDFPESGRAGCSGTSTRTAVPPPGRLSMLNVAPMRAARSSMPTRPK